METITSFVIFEIYFFIADNPVGAQRCNYVLCLLATNLQVRFLIFLINLSSLITTKDFIRVDLPRKDNSFGIGFTVSL